MEYCTAPCCGHDKFAESEFEKVQSCKANGLIPVTKYISKSTGLVVFHAEVEGPIVSGYIGVITRAEDDNGLPHIIEHMIFLGSEDYPYPGILDKLASKCLANGTNAWTDTDHTCFNLSTAGSDGFCQLLPIYFDHVFYPLLTDAAYKTEVHHITAKGTDAGKIYCEMQAQENNGFCKATGVLYKTLFSTQSGYHWNVGGTVRNLRENCTNEKVKAYHKLFYHPCNTCLIVCGNIQAKQIFRALYQPIMKLRKRSPQASSFSGKVDFSKISHENVNGKQLWATESKNINPSSSSTEITVQTPVLDEEEEEGGCIAVVGFLGPSCLHSFDLEEACGLVLVLKYLTAISSSPLQQALVEKQSSLATSLRFVAAEHNRSMIYFELEGIKHNDKGKIVPTIRECLEGQLKHFDTGRMADVIKSSIQQEFATIEKAPHDSIAEALMKEFIYGGQDDDRDTSTFRKRLDGIAMLQNFLLKSEYYWRAVIKDYILAKDWVTVFVEPSTKLFSEIVAQNEQRVSKRRSILGSKGLAGYAIELDDALLLNSKLPPKRIVKKVKAPSLKSIQYHNVNRIKNPSWLSPTEFPANVCLDDIRTNFVYTLVVMDTTELDDSFRDYLPLFKDSIVNSAYVADDGKNIIPYDEAVASRYRDVQACQMNIGLEMVDFTAKDDATFKFSSGSFSHLLTLLIQIEMDKIDIGMDWIRKILWRTKWHTERIQVAASKLAGDSFLLKQEGHLLCQVILKSLIYDKNSNVVKSGLLNQIKLLNSLGSDNNKKFKSYENDIRTAFDSILSVITDANNLSLHIATNMKALREKLETAPCGNLGSLLKKSFPFEACSPEGCHSKVERRLASSFDTKWMLSPENQLKRLGKNQIIYGIVNADSSYLTMVGPGLTSYESLELPALLTLLQYLNHVDGPVYHQVKGRSFSYSYSSALRVNEGLIYFHLTRCIDLVKAYAGILGMIAEHTSKSKGTWSSELLISAKNSLIFECLETERTPLWLACNSCLAYYRNVPGTFVRSLISKIAKVTTKDLKKVMTKYFAPMFLDPQKNYATAIVCHLDQVESIKEGFEKFGKQNMRVFTSYEKLMKALDENDDE